MIAARAANLQVAMKALALAVLALAYAAATARAEQCGRQAGGARCPNRLCCSRWGWCGLTDDYCKGGCQSQCRVSRDGGDDDVAAVLLTAPGGGRAGVASVVTSDQFERMLPHRDDAACPARGFYAYRAFVAAAGAFPAFAATGDADTRKREVAAFLAQTSHATSGNVVTFTCHVGTHVYVHMSYARVRMCPCRWALLVGLLLQEVKGATSDFCVPNARWPCAPGKAYHARGPMQIA